LEGKDRDPAGRASPAASDNSFVIRGDICFNRNPATFGTIERGFLVCVGGKSGGAYRDLPDEFKDLPMTDYADCLIVPGLVDLHVHAPQFSFRGLGLDMELLDWLETYTYPEEAKYRALDYARDAYGAFVEDLKRGPNTRAVIFATVHVPATMTLMDMLEESGLSTMVGKVNMDRNCPADLREESAARSLRDTEAWILGAQKYRNTSPILTPRFIPSCSDDLMTGLKKIQRRLGTPVQSHLSENADEVEWVRELCPESKFYGDAYDRFGLFGRGVPTVMAHCVLSGEDEIRLMRENGVHIAHCPQSNTNILSGVAPVRKFLKRGMRVGLGSDVAGGSDTSIFRVMRSAIEASKLRYCLLDRDDEPLSVEEAFYLGASGGAFFGRTGGFDPGCEFDVLALDDSNLSAPFKLDIAERLARIIYFSDDRNIVAKYSQGRLIK
jgi:guanine deaminase